STPRAARPTCAPVRSPISASPPPRSDRGSALASIAGAASRHERDEAEQYDRADERDVPRAQPEVADSLIAGGIERHAADHDGRRKSADCGVARGGRVRAAVEHPGEHPAVLTVPGPEEPAFGVLAEPVDVEQLGQLLVACRLSDTEPVREVVAHVVTTERQHR